MDIEQLLTLSEAADLLGYSRQQFYYFVMKNRVPIAYLRGTHRFFDKEVIKNLKITPAKLGRPLKNGI